MPPAPPAPSAPPVPPTPPAPPVPPSPPCPVAPHVTDNHPMLTLLLPSTFDGYLSEPNSDKGPDVYVPAPAPSPRWGQLEDFTWDESAVGADDDVQDAEEGWRAEGDAGAEGGTEADTEAATKAGTAEDVFPEGAPGGDDDDGIEYWHKPNDHKREAYTAAEKLKWVAQLDVAVSVRALARESGIHRKCLANWKRAADFLKEAHSARKRMHGRDRASWYRPMEIKVYERLLDWQRKGTAVSVGRLQEWSWDYMKFLYPLVKWKGSQRWSDHFRRRWNLSVRTKTKVAQKTAAHVAEQCKKFWQFVHDKRWEPGIKTMWIINADQTPLWLEMPATTTVDQTGVRLVPIRSAGYQKERVTVMLACTADGMKLKLWAFFKRKTVPKGPFLKPGFGWHARSSMVVLDSYRGHLTERVKEKFRELNCVPAIIPSGCTAEVQPLDVSINKNFKASVRQQYQNRQVAASALQPPVVGPFAACCGPALQPPPVAALSCCRPSSGAGAVDPGAGGAGAGGTGAGGAGAGGVGAIHPGAGGAGAGGAVSGGTGAGGTVRPRPYSVPLLQQILGLLSSPVLTPPLLCPPPDQSQPPLQPASPLPAPSPYIEHTGGLTKHRGPESRPASPVRALRTGRRVPRPRPPPVPGTHAMALRPSSVPLRAPLAPPLESSLPAVPDLVSDLACAASPTVSRLLATVVTDPSFESTAASALVAKLFASPLSVGGECALGTDVLEDRLEDFECLAAVVPCFASMLLAPEGDPDAPDIPTPRSYAEAITVPPSGVNIVDGMWIFGGRLHEEIWLRRPPGFTGSFHAGTQWILRRPVYDLRQAPCKWHDTRRTTLAALGFPPSSADPSLFLRTNTSLPPFYVLVYVDDLVFATADTKALTLVKSELQKRHTCTDLGELRSYLGLQITRDRARRTITLTQSHMVHQVL
ncbi:unnamed protein product [Closterium sp. NIES-53]